MFILLIIYVSFCISHKFTHARCLLGEFLELIFPIMNSCECKSTPLSQFPLFSKDSSLFSLYFLLLLLFCFTVLFFNCNLICGECQLWEGRIKTCLGSHWPACRVPWFSSLWLSWLLSSKTGSHLSPEWQLEIKTWCSLLILLATVPGPLLS